MLSHVEKCQQKYAIENTDQNDQEKETIRPDELLETLQSKHDGDKDQTNKLSRFRFKTIVNINEVKENMPNDPDTTETRDIITHKTID